MKIEAQTSSEYLVVKRVVYDQVEPRARAFSRSYELFPPGLLYHSMIRYPVSSSGLRASELKRIEPERL